MADSSSNGETSVIAIDIGGGTTKLALISRQGEVRGWQSFPTLVRAEWLFLETSSVHAAGCERMRTTPVVGVSVAVAGFVSADGSLEYNPNLPWLEGVPIGKLFSVMSWAVRPRRCRFERSVSRRIPDGRGARLALVFFV